MSLSASFVAFSYETDGRRTTRQPKNHRLVGASRSRAGRFAAAELVAAWPIMAQSAQAKLIADYETQIVTLSLTIKSLMDEILLLANDQDVPLDLDVIARQQSKIALLTGQQKYAHHQLSVLHSAFPAGTPAPSSVNTPATGGSGRLRPGMAVRCLFVCLCVYVVVVLFACCHTRMDVC